jgi:hypothetical protein
MKPLLFVATVLSLPCAAGAQTVAWAQWAPDATATIAAPTGAIDVTVYANVHGVDFDPAYFANPASFTNAEVANTPGANGSVRLWGGESGTSWPNRIHFAQPVRNPYMALYSLGAPGTPVRYEFINGKDDPGHPSITLLSQGPGHWGGGTLSLADGTLTGEEGNGIIRLNGTFSDIWFWAPDREVYHGFTVGVAAVPEPAGYAMLLAGLGLAACAARRRRP